MSKKFFPYPILILLCCIVFGSVALTYPFGRDQGIYAYVGKLILDGKIDYKYSIDFKPPGVHFVFALEEIIFGKSMLGVRLFDLLWQYLTALIIFLICLKLTRSKIISLISSCLYVFLYYRFDYWQSAQSDGFLNLTFSLAVFYLLKSFDAKQIKNSIIAGIFFGLALVSKYTVILFFPLLLVASLISNKSNRAAYVRDYLFFLVGTAIVILGVGVIYAANDALEDFLDAQLYLIPQYASIGFQTLEPSYLITHIVRLFLGSVYSPIILICFISLIYQVKMRDFDPRKLCIYIWILAAILNLILQGRFFPYHFLVLLPALSVGSSLFFTFAYDNFLRVGRKRAIVVSLLAGISFLGLASRPYYSSYPKLFDFISGNQSLEQMYLQIGVTYVPGLNLKKNYQMVEQTLRHTKEGDKIYIWGFEPIVYYLSGRDCPSRFIYHVPLIWKGETKRYRSEFMSEINKDMPALIFVVKEDEVHDLTGFEQDSRDLLSTFPEFQKFIEEKYNLISEEQFFSVYKLMQ